MSLSPFRRPRRSWPPDPPFTLPEGRVVRVPGTGEFFVRDSGPSSAPPVLLLHGWMFPSDLNWFRVYEPLAQAGYRVLAIDHRGHGRGLRTAEPFRLEDCARDAAAIVRELGCGPVLAVGYSMGGPVAQLMARDHPDTVAGLALCATAQEWRDPRMRAFWRGMAALRLVLNAFPYSTWRWLLRLAGYPDSAITSWFAAELTRGSGRDIAEAGRELGRYDSRPWLGELRGRVPAAVVLTVRDRDVPPRKQRELAAALGAPVFEADMHHQGVTLKRSPFNAALLQALRCVRGQDAVALAA